MLEDLLAPGLALVVCGSAAGRRSAQLGHYYAGPGNKFWRTLARVGLTPIEVIRAATLGPARFLAQSDTPDWGNVAVGQRADLLLVEGDPTRDVAALSAIRAVLQDGVPIARTPVENPDR